MKEGHGGSDGGGEGRGEERGEREAGTDGDGRGEVIIRFKCKAMYSTFILTHFHSYIHSCDRTLV